MCIKQTDVKSHESLTVSLVAVLTQSVENRPRAAVEFVGRKSDCRERGFNLPLHKNVRQSGRPPMIAQTAR